MATHLTQSAVATHQFVYCASISASWLAGVAGGHNSTLYRVTAGRLGLRGVHGMAYRGSCSLSNSRCVVLGRRGMLTVAVGAGVSDRRCSSRKRCEGFILHRTGRDCRHAVGSRRGENSVAPCAPTTIGVLSVDSLDTLCTCYRTFSSTGASNSESRNCSRWAARAAARRLAIMASRPRAYPNRLLYIFKPTLRDVLPSSSLLSSLLPSEQCLQLAPAPSPGPPPPPGPPARADVRAPPRRRTSTRSSSSVLVRASLLGFCRRG